MRSILLATLLVIIVLLIGCSKQTMPYKSLSDATPSTPTSAVVGVQKEVVAVEETSEEKPKTETPETGAYCKDSDYGNNPDAFGKVSGRLSDNSEFEISDTCFGNILFEYNCNNNDIAIAKTKCSRGCQNGFCI